MMDRPRVNVNVETVRRRLKAVDLDSECSRFGLAFPPNIGIVAFFH